MDRDKARVPDGRVYAIRDVKLQERFRHPDYGYVQGDGALSQTGRVVLFELRPKRAGLPAFLARWDGGTRSILRKIRYEVDVDISGVPTAEERRFKKGTGGYSGHHTTRQNSNENKYDIYISTPAGLIFDATISFSRHHMQGIDTEINVIVTFDAFMTKARGALTKFLAAVLRAYNFARANVWRPW